MTALAIVAGFVSGATLIVAIGAQNAFVLRVGLRREHVLPVVLICIVSDAILISAGVAGIGALIRLAPVVLEIVRWAGAAFLIGYAVFAALRAIRPARLDAAVDRSMTLGSAILTCLALTWLNPHVYLDTVLLLGTLAAAQGAGRWFFGAGAALASVGWFALLGFGARVLTPLFAKSAAWRILDAAIAVLMLTLGIALLVHP